MRLTKKDIGKLFDVVGGDGSWIYQLIAVKKGKLLFYSFDGTYRVDLACFNDYRPFRPRKEFPESWVNAGWITAKKCY